MLGIESANQLTCHIHSKNMLSYAMFFHGNMQSATNCKFINLTFVYFPKFLVPCQTSKECLMLGQSFSETYKLTLKHLKVLLGK
jgi:hypothetical protein